MNRQLGVRSTIIRHRVGDVLKVYTVEHDDTHKLLGAFENKAKAYDFAVGKGHHGSPAKVIPRYLVMTTPVSGFIIDETKGEVEVIDAWGD